MHPTLKLYNRLKNKPFGKWIFSKGVGFQVPYFGSISPYVEELEAGYGLIKIKNRRALHNHIRSVHAIAMCNLCELAAGLTLEITLPANKRWLPVGMTVTYDKIARTNLHAACKIDRKNWDGKFDLPLSIEVKNTANEVVMTAVITMRVSDKK